MPTTYTLQIPPNVIALSALRLTPDDKHPEGLKWSGARAIPAIGESVVIAINNLGPGRVESYFIEPEPLNGYLGVKVVLDAPPAWHVKQNPGRNFALVFGAELKAV